MNARAEMRARQKNYQIRNDWCLLIIFIFWIMLVTQKANDIMHVEDRSKMKNQHFHLSIVKDGWIGKWDFKKCLSIDIFKPYLFNGLSSLKVGKKLVKGGKKLLIQKVWTFSINLHQKSCQNLKNSLRSISLKSMQKCSILGGLRAISIPWAQHAHEVAIFLNPNSN